MGEALLFLIIILCLTLALQALLTKGEKEQDIYQKILDNDVLKELYAQE